MNKELLKAIKEYFESYARRRSAPEDISFAEQEALEKLIELIDAELEEQK